MMESNDILEADIIFAGQVDDKVQFTAVVKSSDGEEVSNTVYHISEGGAKAIGWAASRIGKGAEDEQCDSMTNEQDERRLKYLSELWNGGPEMSRYERQDSVIYARCPETDEVKFKIQRMNGSRRRYRISGHDARLIGECGRNAAASSAPVPEPEAEEECVSCQFGRTCHHRFCSSCGKALR